MSKRIVTIYALEHGDRAYIGSALDPTARLREHGEGKGAKCTRQWIQEIVPVLPEFRVLGMYPENDRAPVERAWIGEYVRRGWDIVNVVLNVWPIDSEASARGGRIAIHKLHEINKARGYRVQRLNARKLHAHPDRRKWCQVGASKTNEINKVNGYEAQRRSILKTREIQKAGGYEAQRQGGRISGPVNARKMNEVHKANGWEQQRRALHVRWHINRGITKPECAFCQEAS